MMWQLQQGTCTTPREGRKVFCEFRNRCEDDDVSFFSTLFVVPCSVVRGVLMVVFRSLCGGKPEVF